MELKPGLYRHYKGQHYWVHGLARHTETEEWLVVYETRYGQGSETWWVRPYAMFVEEVELGGVRVPRFRYVGSGDV